MPTYPMIILNSILRIKNKSTAFHCGKLICMIFFSMAAFDGWAQDKSVSGWIKEAVGSPIPNASISLFNAKDSGITKFSVTDSSGKYRLMDLPNGKYWILVSAVGFEQRSTSVFTLSDSNSALIMDTLALFPATLRLRDVTITAVKPPVEMRSDRMILNVANSVNSIGSTAFELLRKAPGLRIDNNNNISVNGKDKVVVYLDGKPSNLGGSDLANVLSAMPSSDIESIEVITNPSARYEASGAAIINIKLKKNKTFGFNGSVAGTGSFGYSPKMDASANINFRKKLFNFYGNYSYSIGQSKTIADFLRQQTYFGKLINFAQSSINLRGNDNHNFKTGIDFFLSKKSTLGMMMNGGVASNDWSTFSRTNITYTGPQDDSVLMATNNQPNHSQRFNYNVNYQYADTSGRQLNVDADYGTYKRTSDSYQRNTYYNSLAEAVYSNDYRNNIFNDIKFFSLKTDYEQNTLGGKIGAGVKFSDVKTGNDFKFYNVKDGTNMLNKDRTSFFSYHEQVTAGYITYSRSLQKWTWIAGLRTEHTNVKSGLRMLVNAYRNVDTSYTNFFPNAAINYRISDKSTVGISYSRRIDRPSYEDLNPFEILLDELTFNRGNPFLKPQYTDNIQAAYSLNKFSVSLGYSNTKDYFANVLDTTEGVKSYQTIRNIHSRQVFSMNTFTQFTFTKWWSTVLSAGAFRSRFTGILNNNYLDISAFSLNIYNEHNLNLSKRITAQISGFLNTPGVEGTFKTKMMGSMDIGIQKSLFKDAGLLKFKVSDVFNSLKYASTTNYSGLYVNTHVKWDSRRFIIAFVYKFGNSNVKAQRQRNTSSEEERKRIKN